MSRPYSADAPPPPKRGTEEWFKKEEKDMFENLLSRQQDSNKEDFLLFGIDEI